MLSDFFWYRNWKDDRRKVFDQERLLKNDLQEHECKWICKFRCREWLSLLVFDEIWARFERDLIKSWARSRQDFARIQSISLWSNISLVRNQAFITRMSTTVNKEIEVRSCVVLYIKQRNYFCIKVLQSIKRLFAKRYLLDILYYCSVEILFCYIFRHSTFYINHISDLTHILLRSCSDLAQILLRFCSNLSYLVQIWTRSCSI